MNAARMYTTFLAIAIGLCLGLAVGDRSRTKRLSKLRVSTILGEPYLTKVNPQATGNDQYEGFIKDLMDKVAAKLGRTYEFQLVKDGKYGSYDPATGQWTGMVGEVMREDVDMAAAAITISSKRERVLDFTKPFMDFGITILIKKPGYGIRSAEDLSHQTNIKYGLVSDGETEHFFRNSSIPTYQNMWKFMSAAKPNVFEKTVVEGVERVRRSTSNTKYAFLIESATASYWVHRKPCNLMTVGELLNSKGYGFATPLNSDLTESLDMAILELRESGDVQMLRKKWWKIDQECISSGNTAYDVRLLTLLVGTLLVMSVALRQ